MPPEPPFGWFKKLRQISNGLDNVNINVHKVGGSYIYLSDIWKIYVAKPPGLWGVSPLVPPTTGVGLMDKFLLSSSHPLPVDSNDPKGPLLNIYALPMFGGHVIHLCKVTSPTEREFFAQVSLGPLPYIHSFGATRKYVILFGHPLYVDPYLMLQKQAAVESLSWKPQDGSTIYIVHRESGKVQTFKTDSYVVTHHVNAYETDLGKIVADFVTFPDPTPFMMFKMKIMTNSTARNEVKSHKSRIRRFIFDLQNNVVKQVTTLNFTGLANRLELPVINEKFRYRSYCYVYGVTFQSDDINFSDFRLVKRDLCMGRDLWWGKPGFYPSEPWFLPRPGATEEDDGLLFCSILDGNKKLSYLSVFDGKTLKEVSKSYLPTFIPFLLHGRFFPSI
uniref:Beta-carotene n=1 Tax=Perinereis aibuhitensis TaxID=126650 RepID=A0A8A6NJE9_PERAI|nr:beta-carotene [Perinereis aibuhitensis]